MTIGARIKELRQAQKMTQRIFSEALGITQAHIAYLESGRDKPSKQLLLSIGRTFGVNLEWLKEGTGEMYASVAAESGEIYLLSRELVAEPQLKKMMGHLERIYKKGDQKKIEVIERILEQFDPGKEGRQVKKKLA